MTTTTTTRPRTLGVTLIHIITSILFVLLSITVALILGLCDPGYDRYLRESVDAAIRASNVDKQIPTTIVTNPHDARRPPVGFVKVEPTHRVPSHNQTGECKLVAQPKEIRVDGVEVHTQPVKEKGVFGVVPVDAVPVVDTTSSLVLPRLPRHRQSKTEEPSKVSLGDTLF